MCFQSSSCAVVKSPMFDPHNATLELLLDIPTATEGNLIVGHW